MDPLPVTSKDEIGQLTDTFNRMQQQLRQVDVARKEFIATASHELRTPIFSLGGFVELLQDEDLDEETRREFLETMGEQVERLQKLSVDLLDLSRLDSGSVELHTEPVDLAELTRSVAGEFHPRLAEHGTELVLDVPDEGPSASCDRERVAQIMRILLDNALRHTPEGTDVTVSATRYNGAAELTVADTGPGLPAGARAKVFERFFTGDAARGAGLGPGDRPRAGRADGRAPGAHHGAREHRLHARAAGGRKRRVRRAAAAVAAALLVAAAGCDVNGDSGSGEAIRGPPGGHDHARAGRRGSRPERRLRPGGHLRQALARRRNDPVDLRRTAAACSRTRARAARARASSSTATATSRRTRMW